jgi:hypothetical protein
VTIRSLVLDVKDGDLVSEASLEAFIDRPGLTQTFKSWATGDSSKMKLIGGMGGADILGQALSVCVNRLDFTGLNQF